MNPFFKIKQELTLLDIAATCNIHIPDLKNAHVIGFGTLKDASESEVSFFHNPKYCNDLKNTRALACFVSPDYLELTPKTTIPLITSTPYRALAEILHFSYSPVYERFEGQFTKEGYFLGKDTVIGKNVKIGPYSVIGPGVHIGDNTTIGAHVTIEHAFIGQNCCIHSGAIIGDESLSFDYDSKGKIYVPQLGCVRIGNNVNIGQQTIIDRGSLQDTVIEDHTSLGGLIHVAHNVQIGKNATIISQTGIAGSTIIENDVIIGGQVGIAGHLVIGKRSQIAAQSGVAHDVLSYTQMAGSPAVEASIFKRQIYNLARLRKNRV